VHRVLAPPIASSHRGREIISVYAALTHVQELTEVRDEIAARVRERIDDQKIATQRRARNFETRFLLDYFFQ